MKINFLQKRNELIVLLCAAVLLIGLAFLLPAVRTGDGAYYYAMVIGLAENHSPALTDNVRAQTIARVGDMLNWYEMVGLDGKTYPFHFFGYSLLCVPAYLLTKWMQLDPLLCFQMTNAILIILLMGYILLRSRTSTLVKYVVIAGYILSSGSLYFQWTHPEIFSSAMMLAAAFAFIDNRYPESAIFATLSSIQNPSAAFFAPFPVIFMFAALFRKSGWTINREKILAALAIIPAFAIAIWPYAFNYIKLGIFNPIAASSFINYSLISFPKFLSLYFDLNEGLIVGLPMIVFAAPVILIIRLKNIQRQQLQNADALLLAAVLMTIPVLAQTNWNPGSSVMLRYCAWIGMPILTWVAVMLDGLSISIRQVILVPALTFQLVVSLTTGGFNFTHHTTYIQNMPWVNFIYTYFPDVYNPEPEIFSERVNGKESQTPRPAYFSSEGGIVTKILSDSPDLRKASGTICGNRGYLNAVEGTSVRIVPTSLNMYYLNGKMQCTFTFPAAFSFTGSAIDSGLLDSGWGFAETYGTWSISHTSRITIPYLHNHAGKIKILITGSALVKDSHPTQRVRLSINGRPASSWKVTFPNYFFEKTIVARLDKPGNSSLELDFTLPDAVSPLALGLSNDSRLLGFSIKTLTITDIKP